MATAVVLVATAPASAHIYWTNQGTDTIGRANLDGTAANRHFIPTSAPARGVAIDGQHVYWAQGGAQGSIGRALLNSTARDQSFIATGQNARGVALDSFGIYWSNLVGGVGAIGRSGLDGSHPNPMFIGTSGSPCGVAVDPDKLWWGSSGDPGAIGRAHGVLDVEPDFITAGGDPCGVAVAGTHVYWANRTGNTIARANRDGTHVRQSFLEAPGACGVAVNGSRIYWTSTASNSIGTAQLDGSRPNQFLIRNVNSPCGIAIDPTATATPREYAYPRTKVGDKGQIHAFLVANTSSSVLDVKRVAIVGKNPSDFKKTGDGCTAVNTAAGGGCIMNWRFSPTAPGDRQATIRVISNASDSPTSIAISGVGVSP